MQDVNTMVARLRRTILTQLPQLFHAEFLLKLDGTHGREKEDIALTGAAPQPSTPKTGAPAMLGGIVGYNRPRRAPTAKVPPRLGSWRSQGLETSLQLPVPVRSARHVYGGGSGGVGGPEGAGGCHDYRPVDA